MPYRAPLYMPDLTHLMPCCVIVIVPAWQGRCLLSTCFNASSSFAVEKLAVGSDRVSYEQQCGGCCGQLTTTLRWFCHFV